MPPKTQTFKASLTVKTDDKTLSAIRKHLVKANAAFKKLNRKEQRIQIAKDVVPSPSTREQEMAKLRAVLDDATAVK